MRIRISPMRAGAACWLSGAVIALALLGARVEGNSLDSLIEDSHLRFVFVGGKGGVGKTTSSSAIASQLSLVGETKRRVLLVSTDPAHSLSDAFRMNFSNEPTQILPDLPNLEVMEVNPSEIMKAELSGWADLAQELGYDPSDNETEGGIGEKVHSFQEWLSGIPGIDEATALSSAIEHIESGRYDMIVFDTAPTGHTLKLLELPKLLQAGLDKLESWQATLWGYWEMFKGLASGSGESAGVKEKVAEKLRTYKAGIGRVASMITNKEKTRFVAVCIAEHLSISETRRLLSELERFDVRASHVVVNQLVTDYLDKNELTKLEEYALEKGDSGEGRILSKALAAAKLTSARRSIQSKYLQELRSCPEVSRGGLTVLEVPLLASEVTGPSAILNFSHFLVGEKVVEESCNAYGVEGEKSKQAKEAPEKADVSDNTQAEEQPLSEKLAQMPKDTLKVHPKINPMKEMAQGVRAKIMADPELAEMVKNNPKLSGIIDEATENPMSAMQYMGDPEVGPFISKAMSKLMPSMGGGSKKRRKRKQGKGNADAEMPDMSDLLGMAEGLGLNLGGGGKKGAKGKPGMPDLGDLGDMMKMMGNMGGA